MKKKKWKLMTGAESEGGQAMVLLALTFVVLIGMAGFAIDIGHLSMEKSQLQNAADAAALAGVVEMPTGANAISVAVSYASYNGMDVTASNEENNGDLVIATPLSEDRLQVECTRTVDYYFAGVLGFESTTITARAVAEKYANWAGEALPFLNLDDDYLSDPEIVAWEKTSPGDFESIWSDDYTIMNADNPDSLYFKVDYLDGVTITKGTVATIKQEVGYIYERSQPDGHVYILSLSSSVIQSGKVKLADGTTKSLSKLKNKDVIDVSQLVLLECIFHDYDYTGKTLYLTYQTSYDIGNGEYPPDYVGPEGGTTRLVE